MFRKSALDRVALGSGWFSWLVEVMEMEPVGGVYPTLYPWGHRGAWRKSMGVTILLSVSMHYLFPHPDLC